MKNFEIFLLEFFGGTGDFTCTVVFFSTLRTSEKFEVSTLKVFKLKSFVGTSNLKSNVIFLFSFHIES